jgi:hypothetical protein
MGRTRTTLLLMAALLLGAALLSPVGAAVTCNAVGEAHDIGGGRFEYCVTVTWGFLGFAVPDRVDVALPSIDDCPFYNPENPFQATYVVPQDGVSAAAPGCHDVTGMPVQQINWVGEIRFGESDCWLPGAHIAYENAGSTVDCSPLSDDTGTFCFTSYGIPMPDQTYYEGIVIKAGDLCLVCDYTGPLPECNIWSPVETTSWGTIKSLYR